MHSPCLGISVGHIHTPTLTPTLCLAPHSRNQFAKNLLFCHKVNGGKGWSESEELMIDVLYVQSYWSYYTSCCFSWLKQGPLLWPLLAKTQNRSQKSWPPSGQQNQTDRLLYQKNYRSQKRFELWLSVKSFASPTTWSLKSPNNKHWTHIMLLKHVQFFPTGTPAPLLTSQDARWNLVGSRVDGGMRNEVNNFSLTKLSISCKGFSDRELVLRRSPWPKCWSTTAPPTSLAEGGP